MSEAEVVHEIDEKDNDELLNVLAAADAADDETVESVVQEVEAEEARAESYEETDSGPDDEIETGEVKAKRVSTKGMTPSEVIIVKVPDLPLPFRFRFCKVSTVVSSIV